MDKWLTRAWGMRMFRSVEGWGMTANELWFSFGNDKNVLNLNSGDDCPTLRIWYTVNE